MKTFLRDLKTEFAGYNGAKFAKDLMAGLTVAAVALPLALAFGVSSGATAASGLITAIIGGAIIGALGGAFYQISGPTGAMAAILLSLVAQYGMSGVFTATILAGILLVLAGIFRLGRLTAFIPMPVIAGFTSGIAVIIALGQLDNFFGVTSVGSSAVEKFASYFTDGFAPDLTTVVIGLAVILFMIFFPKKWNAVVPASLISIIIATAVAMIAKLDVATVGAIPSSLILDERFSFSALNLSDLGGLISPAISIAALGMVESLLCGASAGRMTGVPLRNDRELIAQGVGNIVAPLFGGIPATAAIARTSVAIKSGAQTRLTGIIHAVVLVVAMLALGPVMANIPLAALAGVLLVTAWRMNEWHTIRYIFSHKFGGAIVKFLATMIATIVFDLTVAIIIGIVVALVLLIARLAKIKIAVSNAEADESGAVITFTGAILFANTAAVSGAAKQVEGKTSVVLALGGVSYMDISGAQAFGELLEELVKNGAAITVCDAGDEVAAMLKKSGLVEKFGEENFAAAKAY